MPAFETLNATDDLPLFIFADHASPYIPARLNNLGLNGEDLTRHIAHDIGTDGLTRALATRFRCAGHIAKTSRLVIDCNRAESSAGLIPAVSDATVIPGNQALSHVEKNRRLDTVYRPYHAALGEALDEVSARSLDPLIVSLHSFTPQLKSGGAGRLTEIGLLYKTDTETAFATQEGFMRMGRNFTIGMNAPYSAHVLNHTVDVHITPRGLRHVTFEVRQDLIDTDEKVIDIAGVLETILEPLIYKHTYPIPIRP